MPTSTAPASQQAHSLTHTSTKGAAPALSSCRKDRDQQSPPYVPRPATSALRAETVDFDERRPLSCAPIRRSAAQVSTRSDKAYVEGRCVVMVDLPGCVIACLEHPTIRPLIERTPSFAYEYNTSNPDRCRRGTPSCKPCKMDREERQGRR